MIKVLVTEDEKVMRFMITDFLESFNYEVHQAENGLIAYKLWQEIKPDIIITDINMPVMNGISLLQRVKEINAKFPVVLITGVSVDTAKKLAQDYKADGFLAKPFKMKELVDLIVKLTNNED